MPGLLPRLRLESAQNVYQTVLVHLRTAVPHATSEALRVALVSDEKWLEMRHL
jgi:hypothetical protein